MTVLPVVLWKTTVRYIFRSYMYLSLSVIGIAIGVAVVVAVDLSGATVSRQLQLSNDAVMGRSTHQIVSGQGGISEEVYAQLRRQGPQSIELAPIVQGVARIDPSGYVVTVIGIDPFAETSFRSFVSSARVEQGRILVDFLSTPNTALVASSFVGFDSTPAIGKRVLVDVAGRSTELQIVGLVGQDLLPEQSGLEDILFTDISTAQELFGKYGMLTRIDLIVKDDGTLNEAITSLEHILPADALVVPSNLRADALREVTRAFDLNLTALSLLSLMVGVFLIYNTMSFSVVRRRNTMGLLRAIGVTRAQIMVLLICEATIFAVFSSTLGLLLGIALADVLLNITVRTLTDVFITSSAYQLHISLPTLMKGMTVGLAATIVAAIVPAYEATTSSTTSTMRSSSAETAFRGRLLAVSVIGVVIVATGMSILYYSYEGVLLSLVALALVTLGMTLQVPTAMALISHVLTKGLTGSVRVIIFAALRSIDASLSRTAIAVSALSLAVAVTIGMGLMIGSFRTTVAQWLDTSLDADIYVSPPSINSSTLSGHLDPELIEVIARREEVDEITRLYTTQLATDNGQVQVAVVDAPARILKTSLVVTGSVADVWERFQSVDSILVSESYSLHNDVSVGDSVRLPTATGDTKFLIRGVYRDYSSTQGVIMFHHTVFDVHWSGRQTSSIAVYVHEGTDIELMIGDLYELSAPFQHLQIRDSQAIYNSSLEIFDRTFELTSVLRSITVVVACIGILSSLVAHQIERAREGMIFRAIGMTPYQLRTFMGAQGLFMGIYAGLLSVPIGIVVSWFLVEVINRQSFGWEMDLQLDWMVMAEGFLIAVGASTVAGLYPAFRRQGGTLVAEMSRDL